MRTEAWRTIHIVRQVVANMGDTRDPLQPTRPSSSIFDIYDSILYFRPCTTAPNGLTHLGGRKRVDYRI